MRSPRRGRTYSRCHRIRSWKMPMPVPRWPSATASSMPVQIRRATPQDIETCGRICYEAFTAINQAHNFPPDLPTPELGRNVIRYMFTHPGHYSVVAELD